MKLTRHRKLSAVTMALTLSASLGLAACGSGSGANADCETVRTIGYSHPSGEVDAVIATKTAAKKRAKELDCVELLLDNTQNSSLESQRETIESWVNREVDAIVMWPVDYTALTGLQKQTQAYGGKWLTYASKMEGQDGAVGFDNVEMGKLVADDLEKWLEKTHPDGDITAAVTTNTALPTIDGRSDAPIATLKKAKIDVVSKQDCDTRDCGLQIAENTLREHPDLRVFIGVNDGAAIGALKAFTNAGIDPDEVYIAGQDGEEQALKYVKKGGAYKSTAAIRLDELGASIVDTSLAAIDGKGETKTLAPLVLAKADDPETIDDLLKQFQ